MSLLSVTVVAASLMTGADPSAVLFPSDAPTVGTVRLDESVHATAVPSGAESVGYSLPDAPQIPCHTTTHVSCTQTSCSSIGCPTVESTCAAPCVSATSCAVIPANVCNSGVCSHRRGGYMSASAWEQCCEECYGDNDHCWQRYITKYCVGPGDMHPHYPYMPMYHGYYYLRPYNYTHIDEAVAFAAQTGGNVAAPYNTDHLRALFATAPKLPRPMDTPGAFDNGLPMLENLLNAANTEVAPAPKPVAPMPALPKYDN